VTAVATGFAEPHAELPDLLIFRPRVFADARGDFRELYHAERYRAAGLDSTFVQDNLSRSHHGVLRGLHLQFPNPQGKLVAAIAGAVLDVAVDVRRGSPTFGRWASVELTAENGVQLWIPPGFAHGFVVLSDAASFAYKCTAPYSPADELTVRWDDPALGIDWRVAAPVLSEKDAAAPPLAAIPPERLPTYEPPRAR
jgi:dTDP-4-dehydrorhamnose 3,5-epimerase